MGGVAISCGHVHLSTIDCVNRYRLCQSCDRRAAADRRARRARDRSDVLSAAGRDHRALAAKAGGERLIRCFGSPAALYRIDTHCISEPSWPLPQYKAQSTTSRGLVSSNSRFGGERVCQRFGKSGPGPCGPGPCGMESTAGAVSRTRMGGIAGNRKRGDSPNPKAVAPGERWRRLGGMPVPSTNEG